MTSDHQEGGCTEPLRLASSQTEAQREMLEALKRVATGEFMSGSFQGALAKKAFLFDHRQFKVEGIEDTEQAIHCAQKLIFDILIEKKLAIKASDLPLRDMLEISCSIGVNLAVEQWLKSENMELADFPNLPNENINKHVRRLRDIIWKIAGIVSHREEIESLLKKKGVMIHNQDTTRLLVHGINKDCLVPKVLVLPNDHKPYDPYLVALINDIPLPAEIARILRCFNR